jgi:hypothetical protein
VGTHAAFSSLASSFSDSLVVSYLSAWQVQVFTSWTHVDGLRSGSRLGISTSKTSIGSLSLFESLLEEVGV